MQRKEVDGAEVAVAMQRIGYMRCAPRVFKADWTADDVYNMVSLYTFSYAGPAAFVSPKFALKCHSAERFSLECYQDFRNLVWPSSVLDAPQKRWDTTMSFGLSAAIGGPGNNSSWPLMFCDHSQSEFIDRLIADVLKYIVPRSKGIVNQSDAYRFLLSDYEIARWFRSNGVIRAGIIAHIGHGLNMPLDSIAADLSMWKEEIARNAKPWSADRYMERVYARLGFK